MQLHLQAADVHRARRSPVPLQACRLQRGGARLPAACAAVRLGSLSALTGEISKHRNCACALVPDSWLCVCVYQSPPGSNMCARGTWLEWSRRPETHWVRGAGDAQPQGGRPGTPSDALGRPRTPSEALGRPRRPPDALGGPRTPWAGTPWDALGCLGIPWDALAPRAPSDALGGPGTGRVARDATRDAVGPCSIYSRERQR